MDTKRVHRRQADWNNGLSTIDPAQRARRKVAVHERPELGRNRAYYLGRGKTPVLSGGVTIWLPENGSYPWP